MALDNVQTVTAGQIAYETYFVEMENTAPAGSLRWQAQEGRVRDAWEAAAQAVLDQGQQRISLLYVVAMEAGDQLQLCGAYLSNEAAESHLAHARTLMPDRQFCVRVCPCALTARAPGWSPRAGPGCEGTHGDTRCPQCAGTGWVAAHDPEQPAVILHQEVHDA